jgi:plastocyanin
MREAAVLGTLIAFGLAVAEPPPVSARTESGAIEGRITFAGKPPPPVLVVESGSSQQILHVDGSGGLRYAVVYLPDAPSSGRAPATPATMDQRRFIFEPQVLAVRAGQIVRFTNSDPANHNVRSQDPNPANTFAFTTAGTEAGDTHRFASMPAGRPLQLSCDYHPWMVAWIYVFDHDRFAVTAADGRYRIDNVPPGRYRIAVRQPSGRFARDLAADVRAGEATRLDVRFTAADRGMPAR